MDAIRGGQPPFRNGLRDNLMGRRTWLSLFLTAALAIALCAAPSTAIAQVQRRPNILLIVTDDQRAGTVASMMPHTTERFVHRGTRFSEAFTTTPLCCPSRVSMLTGRYAHNHRVFGNREEPNVLSAVQQSMMQRFLHDAGYWTGLVGKFLNNWPNERDPAHFDRWKTTPFVDYFGAEWNVNGSIRVIRQNSTTYIGGRAARFIRGSEQRDRIPWFLHVGFMAPHLPATVERRYRSARIPPLHLNKAMRERNRTDKPPFVQERPLAAKELIARRRARQLRSLIAVDDQVERIMSTLDRLGETGRTLAIFVSDNGYLWGEHGLFQKSTPYQPSARIPMAITWPGRVARGATDDRLSAIIDLAPTVLSAARVRPPPALDGMNLFNRSMTRGRLLLEFRQVDRSACRRGVPSSRSEGCMPSIAIREEASPFESSTARRATLSSS
jgi:arylsulfatase A-like enzyme